ncbi:MAG: M43 family zinc metalloprotease, partial [Chitinophagales bacterium]
TRTETTITQWNLFAGPGDENYAENIKFTDKGGHDIWDRNCYLNIWVGDLGSSILGYAQPPGGSALKDGVVIGYKWIGRGGTAISPYNKGRTATHEIGHWLSLKHIWGDDGGSCSGSDLVADTPNQASETYGCPAFPKTDACSPAAPGIMFMNYMDYTDDDCMNIYTQGQSNKMRGILENTREEILACAETVSIQNYLDASRFDISLYPNPAANLMALRLKGVEADVLFIDIYNSLGQKISAFILNNTNQTTHLIDVSDFTLGNYLMKVSDGYYSKTVQFVVAK